MSWIRDEDEACLVELHAQGSELLKRYRDLLDDDVPPPGLADALRQVVEERRERLERLADRLRSRDALPRAGDPDRAWVQALADALGADSETMTERLIAAETRWRETLDEALDQAVDEDWDDADAEVLEQLSEHMDRSVERLETATGPDD